jgi:VCBS repeat-containing protein
MANGGAPAGTVEKFTKPTHGTAEILENSDADHVGYVPNPDYHGNDTFSYDVCDEGEPEKCATAKVTMTIDPLNDDPVASDHQYATKEDKVLRVVSERGLRSNDKDVDKDKTFASVAREPEHGTLELDVDGSFTYKPHANFYGEDLFSYKLDDGNGGTDIATAKITVGTRNDRPKVDPEGPYYVNEGDSIIVSASGSDIEGEALTYDWDLDNNGSFETPGRSSLFSAENLSGPSTYNIKV